MSHVALSLLSRLVGITSSETRLVSVKAVSACNFTVETLKIYQVPQAFAVSLHLYLTNWVM